MDKFISATVFLKNRMVKYIAFVCGHNAGRSQMAQAAFNHFKRLVLKVYSEYEAISWGTETGSRVNPKVIEPLKAIGIDLTDMSIYFPKDINHPFVQERLKDVIKVYTMGCMDKSCKLPPEIPKSEEVIDWALEDPAKEDTNIIAVRDKLIRKILELISELSRID